jgi:hypothetical protein
MQQKTSIPDAAVDIFSAMQNTVDREEWQALHSALMDVMGLPPWRFPAIRSPHETCPFSNGDDSAAATEFWRARELYDELIRAKKQRINDGDRRHARTGRSAATSTDHRSLREVCRYGG